MSAAQSQSKWQWENATAGAVAGFATVAATHPLDVVRTRFQVNDGRVCNLPTYKNTAHAVLAIARFEERLGTFSTPSRRGIEDLHSGSRNDLFTERKFSFTVIDGKCLLFYTGWDCDAYLIPAANGLKGLYAGFLPSVLGSTVSWGLYFFFYGRAKQRYSKNRDESLSAGLHLASAAEAGGLVCLCTNPVWLIKTRLQLQNPLHQTQPYSGLYDALKTIMREEGWMALYKGIVPGLFLQVSHGAIQFTAYEELRKVIVDYKSKENKRNSKSSDVDLLNSADYAVLGGSSKVAAIILTYPFQVVRARLQQRPSTDGVPKYMDSWHVVKETVRFEGFRGFYKGIIPNLLKNVPAASITFIVYENVLKLLKLTRRND